MNIYMKIEDGQPTGNLLAEDNLEKNNIIIDDNYALVYFTERPQSTLKTDVTGYEMVYSDGKIVQEWQTRSRTIDEFTEMLSLDIEPVILKQARDEAREERNSLLRSDVDTINPMRWENLTDSEKEAWRTYRQALLDVPAQTNFPWEITWPGKPE